MVYRNLNCPFYFALHERLFACTGVRLRAGTRLLLNKLSGLCVLYKDVTIGGRRLHRFANHRQHLVTKASSI